MRMIETYANGNNCFLDIDSITSVVCHESYCIVFIGNQEYMFDLDADEFMLKYLPEQVTLIGTRG